jgi:hypothetical protein
MSDPLLLETAWMQLDTSVLRIDVLEPQSADHTRP